MSSKISIILVSLALLCSFDIHEALAQGPPPLVPPLIGYGVALVDNVILDAGHNVSIKMELFLVIFLDGSDDQTRIVSIGDELETVVNSGGEGSLPNLQWEFGNSSNPPTSLSGNTSVADVEPLTTAWPLIGCWQVIDRDNHNAYTVQIIEPASKVLEVYQHNGVAASNTTSDYSPVDDYNYWVEIPRYSDQVFGDGGYVIREAGKVTTGDKAYAYVNDIRANKIYIDGEEVMVTPPYITIDENKDVMKIDIYAPSLHEFIIELAEGGNQISFPLQLQNNSRDFILSTLDQTYDSVWMYDPTQPPGYKWLYYLRTAPEASSMGNTMESGIGYWIEMNQSATLTIHGTPHTAATRVISLSAGGNLVGYNSQQSKLVVHCMASAGDNYDSVWVYDPTQPPGYKWLYYLRTAPEASSLESLEPGMGLWIEANQAFDLDIGD